MTERSRECRDVGDHLHLLGTASVLSVRAGAELLVVIDMV